MAAKIDDPGSLYYNPAVSAWFKESQIMLGLHILRSNATFSDDGSYYTDGNDHIIGMISGDNGGNAGGYSMIPNAYMIFPMSERFALGLGITATSGTATSWGSEWVGRYQAIKTAASSLDISPSISWMVTDNFSIGAGIDIQYRQQEKINAVDGFGAAFDTAQRMIDSGLPKEIALGTMVIDDIMASYSPGELDSIIEINEDSLAMGWNIGLLYEPFEGTRIGLSYRSRISHSPEGDAEVDTPYAELATADMTLEQFYSIANLLVDTDTESDMDLPPVFIFGLYQRLSDRWALLLDIEHTMWSSIDEVTTIFDSNQPDHITQFEWEDTWRVAAGFEWYYSEAFTFRFGGAWDQAPAKEVAYRTPRMPDVDRYWASLGLTYKFSEALEFDFAYMHLFMDKGNAEYYDINTYQQLNGTYVGSADLFSAGMVLKF
jgi:long-chain fatty acid transport protein